MPHVDFIFTFHFPPSIFIHMVKKVLIQIHCKPVFSGYLWSCGLAGHALFKTQVGGKHTQLLFDCMLVCEYVWCVCVCCYYVDILLLLSSPTVSNVPHPCLTSPPVNWSPFPVNWSPNEQDHISIWGRVMCQLDIFILRKDIG